MDNSGKDNYDVLIYSHFAIILDNNITKHLQPATICFDDTDLSRRIYKQSFLPPVVGWISSLIVDPSIYKQDPNSSCQQENSQQRVLVSITFKP